MSHHDEAQAGPPADSRSNAPDMHRGGDTRRAAETGHVASCCAPSRAPAGPVSLGLTVGPPPVRPGAGAVDAPPATAGEHLIEQVVLPGGRFRMGDSTGDGNLPDGETPVHEVEVAPFSIDATSVTNADFARFVDATGHVTEAESFGFSAVFHLAVDAEESEIMGPAAGAPWWYGVRGADWRHPGGSRTTIEGLADHPVVHVSWNDAMAYCAWAARRLPTEAEWEFASRGGRGGARYPWGDELMTPEGQWRVNIFQGEFPERNTAEDGWPTTAPVRSFQPNGYGLWQTVGNVWEWCADWFDAGYYRRSPEIAPGGPAEGEARVMRGGSYLCHASYCNRYRNSARSSNTPDSSMGNAGFRTVAR